MNEYTQDFTKTVEKWTKECDDHTKDWREETECFYNLVAGDQWDTEERAAMEEMNRPIMTFNRVGTFIDAVAGLEISNRQEVRYLPREPGDVKANEILTGAADWVRDNCEAEEEESDAFLDLVISGMGWTETSIDYEEDPEGKIIVERISPLEMKWDPTSRKRNLADAKWIMHVKEWSGDDARDRWPQLFDSMPDDMEAMPEHDATEAWKYEHDQSGYGNSPKNTVKVGHVQWCESVPMYKIATGQGMVELSEDRWEQMREMYPEVRAARFLRKKYFRCFIAGSQMLGEIEELEAGYTFHCMTGKRDNAKNVWYGMVRSLKDPQKWANKFFSSILQDIATSGKGLVAEKGAFANWQRAQEDWADPTKIVQAKDGGLQKMMPKPAAQYPVGTERLMEHAINAFNDVTGISSELMGLAAIDQPGVLEAQRKQSGMTVLAWCFDALRRYRKEQGRLLAHYIINYIADGRLVKIVGQEKSQYVPLMKQQLQFQYDVIVDDSPSSANQKEKTWGILQSLIPNFAQIGVMPPPEVLEYLPLPSSLIEAWKAQAMNNTQKDMMIKQLQQQLQMLQSPMAQAQLQEKQLDNAKTQQEIQEVQSKTQLNQARAADLNDDKVVKMATVNKMASETGRNLA